MAAMTTLVVRFTDVGKAQVEAGAKVLNVSQAEFVRMATDRLSAEVIAAQEKQPARPQQRERRR